jgi:FKBP-type peptidyl-prolyl cis-trans isomerase
MIAMNNYALGLGLILALTGCLRETETDLDRAIARDDAIMEEYITNNNIDATKTQSGFYYQKITAQPDEAQYANGDYVGIYYEIKTIDGQLVHRHLDETKEPEIFKYTGDGIWPGIFGYATSVARVGEELMVYSPSYLAYYNYSYQQMIRPSSNLVIQFKFARKYTEGELL